MAADSDGSGESLTTVVTCEGDLQDPDFPAKFELLLDKLRSLLCGVDNSDELHVQKLEPWNSVRVTLAIPRDAALRLRQLASEGSQQLRALGILSVQLEGDQVISLRLATSFGQEPQEIILRTDSNATSDGNNSNSGVVSGLTRILTANVQSAPSTSTAAPAEPTASAADKVQFRSPNVVCPTDTQVPKVPSSGVQPTASTSGVTQRNYNGPFPFASMTHAAQAIHSREHAFTQPPPPYPSSQAAPVVKPPPPTTPTSAANPNVAMSSPLLVNLLQNDGAQTQPKKQAPPADLDKFNNSSVPTPNSNLIQPIRPNAARLPPHFVHQKVPVRPAAPPPPPPPVIARPVRPALAVPTQKFPSPHFPRQNFRAQPTAFQQNFQQFPSPPPYPRQRLEAVRPVYQAAVTRLPSQSTWPANPGQFSNLNLQPIAQPMPHLGSLNAVLDSTLSNITPSLTDLSKTDLDSLLPSLDEELDSAPSIPELPESLTSTGKRRQYLINPLTGVLEPMPSDSSGSESDAEDAKEPTDIFNDLNSPLNDRSNSIYSDDDTCSTTISRKFDTTDQSDSEATVKSTNSETSVKSHQRIKSGKNRDRNRDSPGLKKSNKDLPTEKIKLRLKLEKSEPVSPAYKVDISFINTQQPKRATQNNVRPTGPQAANMPCAAGISAGEELRVPPLHISLRGRNSVVINSEKKKKYPKLNPDGSTIEMKKSKKTIDGLKVKKSLSAKELAVKSGSLLPVLSKSEPSLVLPSTSSLEQKIASSDVLKSDIKTLKSVKSSDIDDLPLKHRMREPGEILTSKSVKPLVGDAKKSRKKFNHVDLYREQNLLTGGHLVDDYKSYKKPKNDEKNPHKSTEHGSKLNAHFKKEKCKDKLVKERVLPGHVGEMRRGSDSEVVKSLKRHADSNGLSHAEKKRRLSQSEGKTNAPTFAESQGANKSVKLKPSSPDTHLTSPPSIQPIVGSTNVGTITSMAPKSISKSSPGIKTQKPTPKFKREKMSSFIKSKEGNFKSKDLNRDKTYSQNVAEKLAKQLPTIGEMDMEAKFKQSLLEASTDVPRRLTPQDRKIEPGQTPRIEQTQKSNEFTDRQKATESIIVDTRQPDAASKSKDDSPGRKSTETELPRTQRLDDKQPSRSPNSGGQGEDSGIESMDALSEKSPNQASQSPHSHEIILADPAVKTKSENKLENCLTDLMDIEEQLAKMDGLPTLNGDLSHMIKTEPFMKTETLIEKLEGTEGKDLNENKELVKETILGECCGSISDKECKIEICDLPLSAAMQESLKQGNISVTALSATTDPDIKSKNQPEIEISLVSRKFNCDEQKSDKGECKTDKDLDFDPLPIRRKPPLYTYSNPEKQSRDSESPIPNLSDLDSENSDCNSECSENKSKISQKAATVTRRRKQNLDTIPINDNELDACMEAMNSGHYLAELTGFKKNDIVKKTPKSLLEQLLIEIPSEISDKQISSTSPSVSEKSLNTSKSSIRTRSSSKLNSPDISESSKSEKSLKTPRYSPEDSPVLCSKTSPKSGKNLPVKRKRQESESSTQSNVSLDESGNNSRSKKSRKCSENAIELIKACMGVEHALDSTKNVTLQKSSKETKKIDGKMKPVGGLLRKSQLIDLESSDSDEPLIEIAGKVRNKHVATRNKLNSTKSSVVANVKTVPLAGKITSAEEKAMGTRRSVRNNAAATGASPISFKTRSKPTLTANITPGAVVSCDIDANRRKTRSAGVSDEGKRRRNSRDSK